MPGDVGGGLDVFVNDLSRIGVQQLAGVVVSNKASAKLTLDLAQRYRAELLDYRSKLGATTSRISTFVNILQSSTINYKAASSRITDADIVDGISKSIAAKIRQDVATSLLFQANQAPQIALSLLKEPKPECKVQADPGITPLCLFHSSSDLIVADIKKKPHS